MHQPGDRAVSGKLKRHTDRLREKRRHAERERTEKRRDQANGKSPLPAADKSAEQHGNVHRAQHGADLLDLSGQKRHYVGESQEKGGENHSQ